MPLTPTYVNETEDSYVFVVDGHLVLLTLEAPMTVDITAASEALHISVSTKTTRTHSAKTAIGGVRAALLTIALALWPALGWRLWNRWNPTTRFIAGQGKN